MRFVSWRLNLAPTSIGLYASPTRRSPRTRVEGVRVHAGRFTPHQNLFEAERDPARTSAHVGAAFLKRTSNYERDRPTTATTIPQIKVVRRRRR